MVEDSITMCLGNNQDTSGGQPLESPSSTMAHGPRARTVVGSIIVHDLHLNYSGV